MFLWNFNWSLNYIVFNYEKVWIFYLNKEFKSFCRVLIKLSIFYILGYLEW